MRLRVGLGSFLRQGGIALLLHLSAAAPALAQSAGDQRGAEEPGRGDNPSASSRDDAAADLSAEEDAGEGAGSELPDVIKPQLVEYVPPEYPPEAFEEGIEATVQLELTINVDGSVSDPKVVSPVGRGFDEAALAAAEKLKFSPALVQGEPRAVRIGYAYNFTIDETEVETPPDEEEAKVGDLGGLVLIDGAETPLVGAEITLVDALGNEYEAFADEEGRWRISALQPGEYDLTIRAEGFSTVESVEEVEAGQLAEITFRVLPEATEFEVVVRGERPPRELTKRTIQRREVQRIPGTNGDALRSIQSLPGVARPPGLAGLLIVRGSAPQATGTFIDGEEIPLIYHFGGLSSVVPTELLDKIDFYPGNFSVRYGRFTGGIVDAGLRNPNTECYGDYAKTVEEGRCFHGLAQVDFIDGRLLLQGPVPGTEDWSFALAGRRSWIDVLAKPILEGAGTSVTTAPVYYDYQAIVERNRGPDDKLSFRFYGSDDALRLIVEDPAASDPGFGGQVNFGTGFFRAQVLYQKQVTREMNIDTMFAAGFQRIDFELGSNLKFQLDTVPVNLRSEIGYQVHETAKVNVGFDFQTGPFDVFVRAPPIPSDGEAAPPPLATSVSTEQAVSGFVFRPAWYTDVEWQPTKRFRFVPGFRLDYARDSGHADLSPRATARYSLFLPEERKFWNQPLGTVLKAGVGKFSQPPAFQQTDEIFGTPGIRSNHTIHYSIGVEQDLTAQVDVSLEAYYKDAYNSIATFPSSDGNELRNSGSGSVYGLETLLKYDADERFFGWVAYTLSRSVVRDCDECELRRFDFDQTHNLIVLGSYRLGRGWEFGARFRIVSGPLETPVASPVSAIFSGDAGTYLALPGETNSQQLPLFHQLDVRVDKRWQFRTWQLSAYLDVQNVYNNAAAEGFVYNFDFSQRAVQTGLPIIPALGLRGEF